MLKSEFGFFWSESPVVIGSCDCRRYFIENHFRDHHMINFFRYVHLAQAFPERFGNLLLRKDSSLITSRSGTAAVELVFDSKSLLIPFRSASVHVPLRQIWATVERNGISIFSNHNTL